jgi:hypothetical protein
MENAEQSPILDGLDRPFYEAASEDRLILQDRPVDEGWQDPPEPACGGPCGSAGRLKWRQTDGSGTSYGYPVVSGAPIASSQPDQPFNRAVIELDDFPSDPSGHPAGVVSDRCCGGAGLRRGSGGRVAGAQVPEPPES